MFFCRQDINHPIRPLVASSKVSSDFWGARIFSLRIVDSLFPKRIGLINDRKCILSGKSHPGKSHPCKKRKGGAPSLWVLPTMSLKRSSGRPKAEELPQRLAKAQEFIRTYPRAVLGL